jgi:hypothetical protein
MNFYRWAMRNGAAILFVASLIIFLISFLGSAEKPNLGEFQSEPGRSLGESLGGLWYLFSIFATAVSRAALTFFGACLLYRLDVQFPGGVAKS